MVEVHPNITFQTSLCIENILLLHFFFILLNRTSLKWNSHSMEMQTFALNSIQTEKRKKKTLMISYYPPLTKER